MPQGNRLQILSPEEYELPWEVPQFTMSERQLFFALTPREQSCYERLRTRRTKVCFLLHLGCILAASWLHLAASWLHHGDFKARLSQ
ncbi:MAG: hypothetical protein EVA67_03620 [OM182 bacterium]|nr:MAG: hypothetical protein EVA67_03620 [OM182 bacterium]